MSIKLPQFTSHWTVCSSDFQANNKEIMKAPHNLLFVWGNHQQQVDSPHKGLVMGKVFPCHDVIMYVAFSPQSIVVIVVSGRAPLGHATSAATGRHT